ncbi:DegT/DnrJ/EryC1/StrS family aminotransferase [uncultured Aquabacterium sp.]|nr:DegT/DnrJ/EryC1/StrS family aminotransferase [uncultured Aquabacterium sp.]
MDAELVDLITLSDPDMSPSELEQVVLTLRSSQLSSGAMVETFEQAFAAWLGRPHAVAVNSGTLGLVLVLRALEIGPGDEVITSGYAWHQIAHAITLVGATPVIADIDYWSHSVDPVQAAARIGPRTRAILATNVNGHPAPWRALRELADRHDLILIEDSTEAIGSRYLGQPVGTFGDVALFDFSQPSALCCGQGAMVVTHSSRLASEVAYLRERKARDRGSVSVGSRVPWGAIMGELDAAVGVAQLQRIDGILARRKQVETWYHTEMQSFEGIKPPYIADEVDEVHWMSYKVHLGKRFTASARNQIIEDMDSHAVETASWCLPLHQQFHYQQLGYRRTQFPNTERIADRSLALPFHAHLGQDEVRFIVKTLKDTSVNVGAGAAIY